MDPTCRGKECALEPEDEGGLCLLHSQREGKARAMLLPLFHQLDRDGVIRVYGAYLRDADMRGISLAKKNFKESDLTGADLQDARFDRVGFDGSRLDGANFEGAILQRCDLRRATSLRRCKWYETIFDGVRMPTFNSLDLDCTYLAEEQRQLEKARYVFRIFKEAYKREGDQDAAGLYYEREMDMKRSLSSGVEHIWHVALWALCGYGERPIRAVGVFMTSIVAYALAFMHTPLIGPDGPIEGNFLEALYFSTVTFTTLGYGDIRPEGISRLLAGTEAVVGIFTISLFIFVFCRRMVR